MKKITFLVLALMGAAAGLQAQKAVSLVEPNLSSVRVVPNPWRADRHNGPVVFQHLVTGSTVKIFTASGRWVKTIQTPSESAAWDLTNHQGDSVASGVYLYLVTAGSSQKAEGKVVVIK